MRSGNPVRNASALAALALALALAGPGAAHAQWGGGYGFGAGYGFGGWGGGGWGFGDIGMSPYDQAMVKEQFYANNAARFNLQNAQAEQAFQSANLMRQQALNTALENQRLAYQIAKDRYDIRGRQASASQAAAPAIPLDSLIDDDGQVLWPDYAPSGGAHAERRQRADAAIKVAYLGYKKDGHAGVNEVVDARRRLHAYGQPALDLLGTRGDARARAELLGFLNALDAAVDGLGNPPQAPASGGQ